MIGNIPENLRLFVRPEKVSRWRWEDVEEGGRETKVRPVYISDATNKKTCETGKTWASADDWDNVTRKHVKVTPTIVDVPNKPFSGLKIITLEIRDKGGRAYKVTADIGGIPNLYFDMREDVLLDCLFNGNLKKDGEVSGQFIFARIGSQMKPIRVGSHLHAKMVEATKLDNKDSCELEVGGIYQSKNGDKAIYLGEFWTFEIPSHERGYEYKNGAYYYDTSLIRIGKPVKVHVFNNTASLRYLDDNLQSKDEGHDAWFYKEDVYDEFVSPKRLRHKKGQVIVYNLQMVKSHSYKSKVGQTTVPDGYVQKVVNQFASKNASPYFNLAQVAHGKLLCLSKERGFLHPLMKPFVGQ